MSSPHLLLVSWWFPPLASGGVFRPLQFCRYLREHGFRVTVLTAEPDERHAVDPTLLEKLPADVRVLRVPLRDPFRWYARLRQVLPQRTPKARAERAAPSPSSAPHAAGLKDRISERLMLPDLWIHWVRPAVRKAVRELSDDPPDLILSSSPPHSMHLVGQRLRRHFDVPWVLDFRDPWVGNPFRTFCTEALDARDRRLEESALRDAAMVIANTEALGVRLRQRHEWLPHIEVLNNGFDPDQLTQESLSAPPNTSAIVDLCHLGNLYGARSGRFLVQAVQRLRERRPDLAALLRVRLIGVIDQRESFLEDLVTRGVDDLFDCPGSVSHAEATAMQSRARALLILGVESEGREVQVPGKLYEYLAAQRPVLTLSRRGGAIQAILDEARFPYELAEPDDPEDIAGALERFLLRCRAGDLERFDEEAIAQFRYDRIVARLGTMLRTLLGEKSVCSRDARAEPATPARR